MNSYGIIQINNKTAIFDLLKLLHNTNDAGKRKIIPLFERLLSTKELLSLTQCGDNYYKTNFWENYLSPMKDFSESDWDSFDSNSYLLASFFAISSLLFAI